MPLKYSLYSIVNLILFVLLAGWLWQQNQPVALPDSGSGKLQCASYAPYYGKGQSPFIATTQISPEQIDHDLRLLAERFDCVRTYSVGQGLHYVPEAARKLGMKVLLGVWIGWVDAENNHELTLGIKLSNQYPEVVRGLIVGNEVLLRKEQPIKKLRGYLQRATSSTDVPVTYADVWEFWLKNKALEDAVDYVTIHILPYWEDEPQANEYALEHTTRVMDKLSKTFKKPIFIGETGWPSVGRQRNAAAPGQINQARYLRQFVNAAHDRHWQYNIIEAIDQPWKRVLEGTVGAYWGIYNSDLQAKFDFNGKVAERNDHWQPLGWILASLLLFIVLGRLGKTRLDTSQLLTITPLAMLAGLMAYLQFDYLQVACRDLWEWLALGGIAVIGGLGLLAIPALIFQRCDKATRIIRVHLWLLASAALLCGLLLLLDGRYRDFPISLYALPALQFGLLLPALGFKVGELPNHYRQLAAVAALAALALTTVEPLNQYVWIWMILTLLFCLSDLYPATAVNTQNTSI